MKQAMPFFFIIGLSLAWLVPFYEIAAYGYSYGREPNLIVLWAEIAMFIGLIAYSIISLCKLAKNR